MNITTFRPAPTYAITELSADDLMDLKAIANQAQSNGGYPKATRDFAVRLIENINLAREAQ